MNLTTREKEMLMMFGCIDKKRTHKRLGGACLVITDPLYKAAACSLRNTIYDITDDKIYKCIYAS